VNTYFYLYYGKQVWEGTIPRSDENRIQDEERWSRLGIVQIYGIRYSQSSGYLCRAIFSIRYILPLPFLVLQSTSLIPFFIKGTTIKETNHISIAPREVCRDGQHLEQFYQGIMDEGGEGIILRDPLAKLESGRSKGFLKHKVGSSPPPSPNMLLG